MNIRCKLILLNEMHTFEFVHAKHHDQTILEMNIVQLTIQQMRIPMLMLIQLYHMQIRNVSIFLTRRIQIGAQHLPLLREKISGTEGAHKNQNSPNINGAVCISTRLFCTKPRNILLNHKQHSYGRRPQSNSFQTYFL